MNKENSEFALFSQGEDFTVSQLEVWTFDWKKNDEKNKTATQRRPSPPKEQEQKALGQQEQQHEQ